MPSKMKTLEIQKRLEALTRRWWFTLLIIVFVCIPSYSTKVIPPEERALTGFITGILTVIQFFILNPAYWWMGILHLPLFLSSLYGLVLAKRILSAGG